MFYVSKTVNLNSTIIFAIIYTKSCLEIALNHNRELKGIILGAEVRIFDKRLITEIAEDYESDDEEDKK